MDYNSADGFGPKTYAIAGAVALLIGAIMMATGMLYLIYTGAFFMATGVVGVILGLNIYSKTKSTLPIVAAALIGLAMLVFGVRGLASKVVEKTTDTYEYLQEKINEL